MTHRIKGELTLPGDKSISHRSALFAALYEGESVFTNFNYNADCTSTLQCLQTLGVKWMAERDKLVINGKHPSQWLPADQALDAGNSGTTTRLLSGLLAGAPHTYTLKGDASLSRRPMKRILDPLHKMGARIESQDSRLPLHFSPVEKLHGIDYDLPVASAQVKSAVLLAGLLAEGRTIVRERVQTRDHTERLLQLPVRHYTGDAYQEIESSMEIGIPNISMYIPGDISSAAFFMVAACAVPGSELVIRNVSLNPTRSGIVTLLKDMGADIRETVLKDAPEPLGDIHVQATPLRNIILNGPIIPNVIDEIPVLTVLAAMADGRFELSDAEELRFKESDRISTMVENLRNVGIEVEEKKDGIILEGPQTFKGGKIITHGDHRIAMSFAIADLVSKEDIHIDQPECVDVSFPGFWKMLNRLVKNG